MKDLLPGRYSPGPRRIALANGMILVHTRDDAQRLGSFQLWVRAGSACDPEGAPGVAHALEHVVFQSKAGKGEDAASGVERWGGWSNGDTDYDWTRYEVGVEGTRLAKAVAVLCGQVAAPGFSPKAVEAEKRVITEEIRMFTSTLPYLQSTNKTYATVFKRAGYRHPGLGTPSTVSTFTPALLRAFHRRWYVPGQMIAVSSGGFPAREIARLLEEALPAARRGVAAQRTAMEPPQRGTRFALLRSWATEPRLTFAFRAPPLAHPDTPGLQLLNWLLTKGPTPLLARTVGDACGGMPGFEAEHELFRTAGVLRILVEGYPAREDVAKVMAATMRGFRQVIEEPLSTRRLDEIRQPLLVDAVLDRDNPARRTYWQGFFECISGDCRHEQLFYEGLLRVKPAELRALATRYLHPDRLSVVLQLPSDWAASAADRRGWLETLSKGVELPRADGVGDAAVLAPWLGRLPAPERTPSRVAATARASKKAPFVWQAARIPGGPQVVAVQRAGKSSVGVAAIFPGGSRYEDARLTGISGVMAESLTGGTRRMPKAQLKRLIHDIGGYMSGGAGANTLSLQGLFVRSDWENGLKVMLDCVLAPAFPPEEVEQARQVALMSVQSRDDTVLALAATLFARRFYRVHPYGRDPDGSEESLEGLSARTLRRLYPILYPPGRLNLVVVGDVEPREVIERVRGLVDAPGATPPAPAVPQEPAREGFEWSFEAVETEAVRLFWGFSSPPSTDPAWPALLVLEKVLGGPAGRLFHEIRERRGLDYSPNIFLPQGADPSHLSMSISSEPQRASEALAALVEVLTSVCAERASADELAVAKAAALAADTVQGRDSNEGLARLIAGSLSFGMSVDEVMRLPERVERVTAAEVRAQARRVFDPRRSLLLVAGPAAIRSALPDPHGVAAELLAAIRT